MTPVPVRVAVIPAAGLGTRFLPVTKTIPKEMLPIIDTPTIELVIAEVAAAGVDEVIIVSAPGKDALDRYFAPASLLEARLARDGRTAELALVRREGPDGPGPRITVIHQDEPRGNGDAVLRARDLVDDRPFLMIWGDDIATAAVPVARQLLECRERQGGGSVAGVMRVPEREVSRYGIVEGDPAGERTWRMRRIIEKPPAGSTTSDLAQVHGYVLEPGIFPLLERTAAGHGGEVWLADAVNALAAQDAADPVWAFAFEGERFDTGDRLGYLQAVVSAALDRPDLSALRGWLTERLGRPLDGAPGAQPGDPQDEVPSDR
ncbi:MAG: UTP--glucose-1-phosphate uridylyltransferase GalU [Candidatus Limnocylindrales bacterium]